MKVYAIFRGCYDYDDYEGGTNEWLANIVDTEENARESLENWLKEAMATLHFSREPVEIKREKPMDDDPVQDQYTIWYGDYYIRYEPFDVLEKPVLS